MQTKGVGLIGGGVVGQGVVELLLGRRPELERAAGPYELIGVAVRDRSRPRAFDARLARTPEELIADPRVDVLVEVAGGVDGPALWVDAALKAGKRVVTANKALLAERSEQFDGWLREHPGRLYFEAAVAGGIPIILALDRGLAANRVLKVEGILNGTCNFILTLMERERLGFAEALALAQEKGFAEADPTLDVGGGDTAHKLAVLAGLALGRPVAARDVATEGIQRLSAFDLDWAERNGFRIKMLGIARFEGSELELRVHPTLVRRTRLLSQVMAEFNAVEVEGDLTGPQLFQGRGAGRFPTASAVVSDIVAALRGDRALVGRLPREGFRLRPLGEVVTRHYLHLEVIDQPGVVAKVTSALAEKGISIASMFQPDVALGSQVPLVLTTHPAADAKVEAALASLEGQKFVAGRPVRIRMEG